MLTHPPKTGITRSSPSYMDKIYPLIYAYQIKYLRLSEICIKDFCLCIVSLWASEVGQRYRCASIGVSSQLLRA